jgi:hypothetical protein
MGHWIKSGDDIVPADGTKKSIVTNGRSRRPFYS